MLMTIFVNRGTRILFSIFSSRISVGRISADVLTAPITVPANSVLLGWAKNESTATATALDSYNLDAQSTSFLWDESQTSLTPGTYSGHFQYNVAIGWQTAMVGLKPGK